VHDSRDMQQSEFYSREDMLLGVSRSFALTIPELPARLRDVVGNAYLLCRIVDTIEDEANLSIDQKRFFFQQFNGVLHNKASAREFASALYPLLGSKTLPPEKELIRCAPRVVKETHSFSPRQQRALKRCVSIMSAGMARFQEIKNCNGLENLSELNSYCYHVAGVVGEMLTELFCAYSPEIDRQRQRLLSLAPSFGQGLQMTNILKDVWDDRRGGACWLPKDVFLHFGFDLADLCESEHQKAFGNGVAELIGIACYHLQQALNYTLLIPRHETGIRRFCAWAVGMAIFTLRNINNKRSYTSGQEVKITRSTLRRIILATNLGIKSNSVLQLLFRLSTKNLPEPTLLPFMTGDGRLEKDAVSLSQ